MRRVYRGLLILALLAIAGCRADRSGAHDTSARPPSPTSPAPGAGRPPEVRWVGQLGALAVGDVDGDATEDAIGLCATQGKVSFCAVRGRDFTLAWRAGSVRRDLAHAVRVATAGTRAVLVDPGAIAHVASLADGRELGTVQLSDRPAELCVPASQPGMLWLGLADESELLLDPEKMTADQAPRPVDCYKTDPSLVAMCMAMNRPEDRFCKGMPLPPPIKGMLPLRVAYDGKTGALLGNHSPGTSYAVVAILELGGERPRVVHQRPLADAAPLTEAAGDGLDPMALAGGRVVAQHEGELVAIDVRDGKTLWRRAMGSYLELHVSPTRVYVAGNHTLEIRDARDGRVLGTFGGR